MKKLKLMQAFTIMELITAMAILMILAGLLVGAGMRARIKAMEAKAESMIASLEIAIGMYHIDTGQYPASDNANSTLVNNLTIDPEVTGWQGPYMEFKERDLVGGEVVDPWGNEYRYRVGPTGTNNYSFDLWSIGADETNATDDDITNW